MARRVSKAKANKFFVDSGCLPQTIDVLKTRAAFFGFELVYGRPQEAAGHEPFGALFQYPNDAGEVAITIAKGAAANADHGVDGLSGATMTTKGVQGSFAYWFSKNGFGPYLTKLKAGE